MKKLLLLVAILFATICLKAQDKPFEGKMIFKIMNSYSDEYLGISPHLHSGADTMVVSIKGDAIHEHYLYSGIHKIYNGGKMYYYSENTKEGFALPERTQNFDGVKDEFDTGDTRTMLGMQCAVHKTLILLNNSTVEMDSWLADDTYAISNKALQLIYTDMCNRVYTDFPDKICMKMSLRVYMTGINDKLIEKAKGLSNKEQRKVIWGSTDKEAKEMSVSQIFEVLSITPENIDDAQMLPAKDILINELSMEQATSAPVIDKEMFVASLMANPMFSKQLKKGKLNVDKMYEETVARVQKVQQEVYNNPDYQLPALVAIDKDIVEAHKKNMADSHAIGGTLEDASFNSVYGVNEKKMLLKNKEYLKEHQKISTASVVPVAYDLDGEWDQ